MSTDIPSLLLVPSLQQTESLRAFMYRTAQTNAYPRMYVGSAQTLKRADTFLSLLASRDLKLSQELRVRLAPISFARHRAKPFLLGRERIPSSFIRLMARSVCPLCLSENPWSRGEWELKAYTCCHSHGVKLVDTCDYCKQKLSWDRTELLNCYCGRELSAISPPSVQYWERQWARQLHLAFVSSTKRGACERSSRKYGPQINISKLFLMVDIVRTIVIPSNVPCGYENNPARLLARILDDRNYRGCLWETIFLFAAKTPLLLSKMLQIGQTNDDLIRNYQGLAEELPIPLALKSNVPHPKSGPFSSYKQATVNIDIRSHVARLKLLYGAKPDESFDPFTMSRVDHSEEFL